MCKMNKVGLRGGTGTEGRWSNLDSGPRNLLYLDSLCYYNFRQRKGKTILLLDNGTVLFSAVAGRSLRQPERDGGIHAWHEIA
jgi:hypothetical protein